MPKNRALAGIGAGMAQLGAGVVDLSVQHERLKQNQKMINIRKKHLEKQQEVAQKRMEILKFGRASSILQTYGQMAEKYGEKAAKTVLEKNRESLDPYFDVDVFAADPKASAKMLQDYTKLQNKIVRGEQLNPDESSLLVSLESNMTSTAKEQSKKIILYRQRAEQQKQQRMRELIGASQFQAGETGQPISPEALGMAKEFGAKVTGVTPEGRFMVGPKQSVATSPGYAEFQKQTAKGLAEQKKLLPKFRSQMGNADIALKVMDRVSTGPISGLKPSVFLQKITNKDAQLFENLLNRTQVEKFMEFAGEAGVRAIDTPQEQERIIRTTSNWKQSPEVLQKVLLRLKATKEEAISRIKEKDAYIRKYKTLEGFESKYEELRPIVNPETNEVAFIKKENKDMPRGFKDLDSFVGGEVEQEQQAETLNKDSMLDILKSGMK